MKIQLPPKERHLLQKINASIFANPFSQERIETDCYIAKLPSSTPPDLLLARVLEIVNDTIQSFQDNAWANITKYQSKDQELARSLFLFFVFHRYIKQFDQHIQEQIEKQDTCCQLCFSNSITYDLEQFGFSEQETDKYIALFFQMRRGFYFIKHTIHGISPCMEELRSRLWNTIFTKNIAVYVNSLWNRMEDFSTLLLGETGTGKTTAARAIGCSGFIPFDRRKKAFKESFTKAFLAINISQYPAQLIESELFGHVKGAFTGAVTNHAGLFSRSSSYGSVFLDEIGEVSIPIQIKLLQILEERVFTPVGGEVNERFSGRIISATNQPYNSLRCKNVLRDDFFYRMSSDIITIPSLKKRIEQTPEEMELLTGRLLKKIIGINDKAIENNILDQIRKALPPTYSWKGNVRELEQFIRHILINEQVSMPEYSASNSIPSQLEEELRAGKLTIHELSKQYCEHLYGQFGTYQEVAKRTGLDRRTVKKYLNSA